MHRRARRGLAEAIELTQHRDVAEMLAAVLAAQHLGVGVVEGDADEKLARAPTRNGICVYYTAERRRRSCFDPQRLETHSNLGDRGGRAQLAANELAVAEAHVDGAIEDELRREWLADLKAAFVRRLPLGEFFRGIRIGPSLTVPVIDMLAQYDETRTADGLSSIELFQEVIGRWARGTAFGGEEFDEHRRIAPRRPRYRREQRQNDGNRGPHAQVRPD